MDPVTIIAIINGAAQLAKAVAPMIKEASELYGEEDAGKIKAAADELHHELEAIHDRVQAKLRG